jgi:hypothetical protein
LIEQAARWRKAKAKAAALAAEASEATMATEARDPINQIGGQP